MAFESEILIYQDVNNGRGKVNRYKFREGTFTNGGGDTGGEIFPGIIIKTWDVSIEGDPSSELTKIDIIGTSGIEITTGTGIDGCWWVKGPPVT